MPLSILPEYSLRHQEKNNFIFQINRFDGIDEILKKYNITITKQVEKQTRLLQQEWKGDLIELRLIDGRKLVEYRLYDVKTVYETAKKNYFEMCESDLKFFTRAQEENISCFLISIVLFKDWKFSFNSLPWKKEIIRKYSNYEKEKEKKLLDVA